MFVDTHCHLNLDRFKNNVADVIRAARKAGVNDLVVPGVDVKSSIEAIKIAAGYPNVYPTVGIHPGHKVNGEWLDEARKIDELIESHSSIVAVGEVGLDRTYLKDDEERHDAYEIQKKLFIYQLGLAVKHKKSLIIHSRQAMEDTIETLQKYWDPSLENHSVFHCCEPDLDLLDFAREHKMFIGVDGDVTYDQRKQWYVGLVPLDMLVLETDSPFLLPEPLRSEKKFPNEPANLPLIAQKIADIKKISEDVVAKTTTENARVLFKIV